MHMRVDSYLHGRPRLDSKLVKIGMDSLELGSPDRFGTYVRHFVGTISSKQRDD